jgi:hypothetical protein
MTTNDLTSAEKVLFDYEKEFQISVCKQTEAMAEKLAFKKITSVRQSAKKVRPQEYGH